MNISTVVDALHELGFQTEEVPDYGYLFHYEGVVLLYMPDEDDDQFFRITFPNIHRFEKEDRAFILDIVNEVNSRIKYTKTIVTGNDVWVSFEQRIPTDDCQLAQDTIEHALRVVQTTAHLFHNLLNGDDAEESTQENDE